MANDVKFEGKERRMAKIEKCLAEYGLASLEEARDLCLSKGINVFSPLLLKTPFGLIRLALPLR